ncbi:MAG: leucine-rich repeat protein [Acutalibacteraceae bacterium]
MKTTTKKAMKRNLVCFIAVMAMLALIPIGASLGFELPEPIQQIFGTKASAAGTYYTEGYYTYCVEDNVAKITDCDTAISGSIVIPASLGGYPITAVYNSAFENCQNLTGVTIGNNVVNIGAYAFENCTGLTNIVIENSVTGIELRAFKGCSGLTSITIPSSVTDMENDLFDDCSNLTTIHVDAENGFFTDIDGVLFNKSETEILCYPDAKPDKYYEIPNSVKSIAFSAFEDCINLTSVTIPDSVTEINEYAFSGCSGLSGIFIPDSVTAAKEGAFENCTGLKEVTVPDTLTDLGYGLFRYCTSLKKVILPDGVTKIIGELFHGCSALTDITIPDTVTSIGNFSFAECSSLTDITIPGSVTSIGNSAFYGCSSLTDIRIPDNTTSILSKAFYGCSSLKSIYIPNSITSIPIGVFASCSSLETVYYPGSKEQWKSISVESQNDDLKNAAVVALPDREADKTIDFISQNDILTIFGSGAIPNRTATVWHLWDQNNQDITTLIINGVRSVGSNTFRDFPSLSSVIILSDNIVIQSDAFVNCPMLENVLIFGNSSFEDASFSSCADYIRLYENSKTVHDYAFSGETINVIPFTFDDSVLSFSGEATLSSYEFFDTLAAFCLEYNNIEKLIFSQLTFEDISFYYIPEGGASLKTIEGNTLINGEIYPSLNPDGDGAITFNTLVNGMADGSIDHFYLVAFDENHPHIMDTEVKITDSLREIVARALRWIVTLLNKLFTFISKIGK